MCVAARSISLCCLSWFTLTLSVITLGAEDASTPGLAWQVQGSWRVEGERAPLAAGDAIPPGSLLEPDASAGNYSITILLPDGQRILYECFSHKQCARGFRAPALYRRPDAFAADMLARIGAVLTRRNQGAARDAHQQARLPRDEVLAVLGPGNRVEVSGLAADLPNGRYSCDVRRLDSARSRQFHVAFEKRGPFIHLVVPGAGLYDLTIFDSLNTPRIDLFLAVVRPAQGAGMARSLNRAEALLEDWNSNYQGWPIHDFQRAYLESLVLGLNRLKREEVNGAAREIHRIDATAEPLFFPKPGVFPGDTAVTLRCATPGAVVHYTVDGSEPLDNSPMYEAPIMVKGTELTIKAFASAGAKKDSAVVTGIYRVRP